MTSLPRTHVAHNAFKWANNNPVSTASIYNDSNPAHDQLNEQVKPMDRRAVPRTGFQG